MSIPKLTTDLSIIQRLSDLPNATEGLTAEQLKAKFDEAGLEIQRWINETLIPAITAGNIPFPKSAEVDAETVEAAILAVREQIADAASGAIVDGTVTKAKLAAALLERVYGGRAWVSLDEPDSTDNPSNDLPVGQIWLRPAFTVNNKNSGDWYVNGGSATTDGHNVTMTGSQTVATVIMTQSISKAAQAGDRIYVLFDVESIDSEITEFTLSINGKTSVSAEDGGVFSEEATGTSVSVMFRAVWPSTSLAKGSVAIKNLAVINVDEIIRSTGNAKGVKNWATFLKGLMPISTVEIPNALYIQKNSGEWFPIVFDVLPVSRGGTGMAEIGDGELLYGKDGGIAKLEKPSDDSFLRFENGNPAWAAMSAFAGSGYARIFTGSYVGNGEERTITLPVEPKLLILHSAKNISYEPGEMFQSGIRHEYTAHGYDDSGNSVEYYTGITLEGNTLRTDYSLRGDRPAVNASAYFYNGTGVTYRWVAIY